MIIDVGSVPVCTDVIVIFYAFDHITPSVKNGNRIYAILFVEKQVDYPFVAVLVSTIWNKGISGFINQFSTIIGSCYFKVIGWLLETLRDFKIGVAFCGDHDFTHIIHDGDFIGRVAASVVSYDLAR